MKPIFTNLAPNWQWDDVMLAARLIFQPWKWRQGRGAARLEQLFTEWLPTPQAFAFSSGRAALYAILKSFGLQSGDEVLLQAYTCVAVPDPILWTGAKPVYVDCEEGTFNMSPRDLERKITSRARVLIIQHTFGLPANLDALLAIAKKHSLFVIEDCAAYSGARVGTFGDAAIFSFGRDKVISSVFGGLAVVRDANIAGRVRGLQNQMRLPSLLWVLQQLLHPIVMWKVKIFYRVFGLGKFILALSKALHLISKAVYAAEKKGGKPKFVERRMSNALALLALHQFEKLEKFNAQRRKIAELYGEGLHNPSHPPLSFPPKADPPRAERG